MVCLCPRLQIPEAVPDSAISYARHACNVSIVSRNGCKWYEGEINKTSMLYLVEIANNRVGAIGETRRYRKRKVADNISNPE